MEQLADRLGSHGRAATTYGEPIEWDGVTVIPVARSLWASGGGGGTGGETGAGSGGGGAMFLSPMGYIEISDGRTRSRPIFGPGIVRFAIVAGALIALSAVRCLTVPGKRQGL